MEIKENNIYLGDAYELIKGMKEWKMNKYSTNRINQGKKIKDFYECEFYMKDLTAYFGESNIGE